MIDPLFVGSWHASLHVFSICPSVLHTLTLLLGIFCVRFPIYKTRLIRLTTMLRACVDKKKVIEPMLSSVRLELNICHSEYVQYVLILTFLVLSSQWTYWFNNDWQTYWPINHKTFMCHFYELEIEHRLVVMICYWFKSKIKVQ